MPHRFTRTAFQTQDDTAGSDTMGSAWQTGRTEYPSPPQQPASVDREQALHTRYEPPAPPQKTPPREERVFAEATEDTELFIRGILEAAIRDGASDIHFEPLRDEYHVRFRVDGVMRNLMSRPANEYDKVLNTFKVLADLDIATHHIPQDGRVEFYMASDQQNSEAQPMQPAGDHTTNYFDIRVSIFPSVNGEVAVLRVLSRTSALLPLDALGMDILTLTKLRKILASAYGMILVTGPTGSGKTTTLYSVLGELKSEEKNIITLEDPVEFHLDWMRQCEIKVERDFTYEVAMMSILRQDPDILMVGEIRDPHTAEYAVRSALVGRIVGSTIHANTTIGTIARLIELGIPRSLLAHAVNGIIAQRLVRKVCEHCKERYTPNPLYLEHIGLSADGNEFVRGRGCEWCNQSGYKGRVGIFSVLVMDDDIRNAIFDQRSLEEINERATKNGMKSIAADAATKVLEGVTTVEDVVRVV